MSTGGANIDFFGNAQQLIREQEKAAKKQQEMIEKLKTTGKEGKAAAAELDKFASATTKLNATPVERYKAQMTQLRAALDAGKISQETFTRATDRAKISLEQAGHAGERSFGTTALAGIGKYLMSMGGIAVAAGAFRSAMAMAREETEGAIASVERLTEARRRLMQVGTSAEDVQAQNVAADKLAVEYGVPRDQARALLFSARSEGFAGAERDIVRLQAANVVDMGSAVQSAGMVRGNFDKSISAQQAVVATMIAAERSRMTAEQFAANLPKLSGAVSEIGATPAETMAVSSVLATRNERANEYVATLANRLGIDQRFKGQGIGGAVQMLQAMPEEERRKILGESKEMNMAYTWLAKDMPAIRETQRALEAGMTDPEAYIRRKEYEGLYAPTHEAQLRLAQVEKYKAANALEISREQRLGITGNQQRTAITREQLRMEERPTDFVTRWGRRGIMETAAPLGMPASGLAPTADVAQSGGALGGFGIITQQFYALIDAIQQLRQSFSGGGGNTANNLDGAAQNLNEAAENMRAASAESSAALIQAAASMPIE